MAKVSIIVPIYGVEEYLRECLDSIVNQTFKDIEIILVDDGSPDNCPQICDEYAQKDNRIKVIHKENGGYGSACNRGIEAASGDYIGIVESDDWIEPDMYEKLYNQITKFDAEVCTADFYHYKANSLFKNGTHNEPHNGIIQNTDSNKLFSILDHPYLFTVHYALWAKLYKKDLIKSIKFDEQPGAAYQDIPFAAELFSKTKKIIGLHENLYHYRIDNNNSSGLTKNSKMRLSYFDQRQKTKEILIRSGLYNTLKEEFYLISAGGGIFHYRMIESKYKKQFFQKFRAFLSDLENDDNFTYKYFNPAKKHIFKSILSNNFRASLFDGYKGINILGLPLIEKTEKNNIKKIRIFNIPIYKKYKRNNYNVRKYLFGLIKTKTNKTHKKIYLLGIQISCKKLLSDCERLRNEIMIRQGRLYDLQKTNIEAAAIHPKTFLEYKNKYENQSIVLIGCGPSAVYYGPCKIKNAVHIRVNRAFKLQNINLDYLFVQDYMGEDDMRAANMYLPEKCKKFYGVIPDLRLKETYPKLKRISLYDVYAANASQYIISLPSSWYAYYHLPFDIAYQPIFDCGGTVISALQFALYTNPKKIYLVGCDCSTGHFHEEIPNVLSNDSSGLVKRWKKLKDIMNDYCPNTEVISINPVGLKGMFKDIYTNDNGEYTDEYGNIIDLNDNKTGREFSKEKYYTCY